LKTGTDRFVIVDSSFGRDIRTAAQ